MSKRKTAQFKTAAPKKPVGPLYGVFNVERGTRVYLGEGLPQKDAERFAEGLVEPAEVRQVSDAE